MQKSMTKTSLCDLIKEYLGQYIMCVPGQLYQIAYTQEKHCSKTSGVQKAPKQGHKHWQRQDRESNHGQNASKGKTDIAMQLICLKVFATLLKGNQLAQRVMSHIAVK